MKKTVKKNIHEVRRIASKMPKSLNEAIYEDYSGFGDITEDEEFEDPVRKPIPGDVPTQQEAIGSEEVVPQEGGEEMNAAPAEPVGDMPESTGENDSLNVEQFVDDIRKKSLRGMAQLAENPDDERYQLLKKIWQICDKKPEQQTAFSNPNQIPQKKM